MKKDIISITQQIAESFSTLNILNKFGSLNTMI